MKTAYATIKGFEVMRSLKKGQAEVFQLQKGIMGEVRLIERCFKLGDSAIAELIKILESDLQVQQS